MFYKFTVSLQYLWQDRQSQEKHIFDDYVTTTNQDASFTLQYPTPGIPNYFSKRDRFCVVNMAGGQLHLRTNSWSLRGWMGIHFVC